jgi:subtilisin family serine protease
VIEPSPHFGDVREGNLLKAIAAAESSGIDVLNISAGIHHRNCQQRCRIADAVRTATESGITIIAAAGNRKSGEELGVYCPALIDEAIAVGGFISKCDEDIQNTDTSGQYWTVEDDKYIGPFCGYETCPSEYPCSRNRQELYWDKNVEQPDQRADILAPTAYFKESEKKVTLDGGTSYAAPIVSGSIVRIFSELLTSGVKPDPSQIKEAVTRTGDPVQNTDIKKI